MTIRKNKKRIDPRYFLNETTNRDLTESEQGPLLGARVVGPSGLDAARGGQLAKPGQSIVITKGWGGTPEGLLQVHVLPKGAGFYEDLKQAIASGFTGEAYYARAEDIASQTKDDNATLGSRTGPSAGGFSYSAE